MRPIPTAIVLAVLSLPLPALATCVCRCVDGQMVPICTNAIDLPPIGTTRCEQKQVWSETQKRYVWREICE